MIIDGLSISSLALICGCDAGVATTLSTAADSTIDCNRYGYLDDSLMSTSLTSVTSTLSNCANTNTAEEYNYAESQNYVETLDEEEIKIALNNLGCDVDSPYLDSMEQVKVKKLTKKM